MNYMQITPVQQGQDNAITPPVEIARLLYHSKWRIIGLTLACGVIAALYAYTQLPTYRAASTVLIEPRENRAVQLQEAYDPGIETNNYFMTQLGIIRSRTLVGKVVDRMNLLQNEEFVGSPKSSLAEFWGDKLRSLALLGAGAAPSKPKAPARVDPKELREKVIDRFTARILPIAIPRTQLIQIYFTSNSPQIAADAANQLADAYIEYGLEARLQTTKKATEWLNEKLADIKGNLEKSEKSLQEFREKAQIVSVGGGSKGLLGEELMDNARRLREAQKVRTELSSSYSKIQQAGNNVAELEQISDLLRLPLVQASKSSLMTSLEALKQLQQRYGEKHPALGSALTRVEAAQRTFRDQLLLAANNVRTEYEIARDTERQLSGTVESQKGQIRNLDRKEYEQGMLEREVASNRQLYDVFLASFKSNDTSSSYEPINVRVLEQAMPPSFKYEPVTSKYLMNGLIVGFVLAIGLVLLRHAMDETVHSPDDLETLTHVPVISVVPKVTAGIGSRKSLPQLFAEHPRTPFAEGIRSIRASLKLNDVDHNYKRILVTSAVPGEGKSSLAGCLALAFGQGEKTLLIEADLRAPTVKKMFGLPKERPGIMELLTGEATLEQCLYLHEPTQTYVLPVAKSPANPAEVINSQAFSKLIATLSERFDHVILDSPPCQAASDSLVLAKLADVVLFTTMADSTHRRSVAAAMKQLKQVQAHVVGCVLNQVNASKNSYYADSYYYARQYYG